MTRVSAEPLELASLPEAAACLVVQGGAVGAHVGILFKSGDHDQRLVLHQAFHYETRADDPPTFAGTDGPPVYWVRPGLDEDECNDVRLVASRMAQRVAEGVTLPYALASRGAFVRDDGGVDLQGGLGLTCATLILAVFHGAHVSLIDEATWDGRSVERQREDEEAQRKLVVYLRRYDDQHASRVAREIGCTRIRAEEVAVASGFEARPASFAQIEPSGRALVSLLAR